MESQELILAASNKPFKTEKAAKSSMDQKGLDYEEFEIKPYSKKSMGVVYDGFGIFKKGVEVKQSTTDNTQPPEPTEPPQPTEKPEPSYNEIEQAKALTFWLVKFAGKQDPNDFDDVSLSVGGETLVIRRERKVVIPYPYLVAAENARYPQISQKPGKPRKTVAHVTRYPREVYGQATKEEYLAQKMSGDKSTASNIKKFGYEYEPDSDEEF